MTTPRESKMKKTTRERRRARRRGGRGGRTPGTAAAGSQTMAGAVQLAIGLLTASLDSPDLQAQAMEALIPDPEALGDFLAGLHVVCQLLLHHLHEATGQPPAAVLQRLAIAAEISRDTPSSGQSNADRPGT
jgi:hypothetical protein